MAIYVSQQRASEEFIVDTNFLEQRFAAEMPLRCSIAGIGHKTAGILLLPSAHLAGKLVATLRKTRSRPSCSAGRSRLPAALLQKQNHFVGKPGGLRRGGVHARHALHPRLW
jgi:hypothetical protein